MQLESIRLLQVLKSLNIGGVEKSTLTYSNILVNNLKLVGIFSPKGRYTKENIIEEKVRLFNDVQGTIGLNKHFLVNLFYLIRVIRQNQINLIFYHFRIFLPFIIFIRILFPKTKMVYIAHSCFNDLLNYLVYADNYIAISNLAKRDLQKFGKSNVFLITHGIKIRKNVSPNNFAVKTIGYIGRFEKNKGIDILLNAFKKLLAENKEIILYLIGEGAEENYFHSFRKKYNLQDNLVIKSPMIDENDLFEGIDLLVFPSTSIEGFGIVILEAMNFGIPVIASDLIKHNSLIEDFKTGVYFKNGDSMDLVVKLKLLLENDGLRENISANAREMIKLNYNLDNIISKYFEFLESV